MLPQYITFQYVSDDMDCGRASVKHILETLEIDGVKPYHLEKTFGDLQAKLKFDLLLEGKMPVIYQPMLLYALDTDKFTPI